MLIPDEAMKAWLAGFMDGEGSIQIKKNPPRGRGRSSSYTVRVSVSNTVKAILELIKIYFGGSVVPIREGCYEWVIGSKKAGYVLEQVLPYLKLKRSQALVALRFQDFLNKGSWHQKGIWGAKHLTKPELEYREKAYKLLQEMKAPEIIDLQIRMYEGGERWNDFSAQR